MKKRWLNFWAFVRKSKILQVQISGLGRVKYRYTSAMPFILLTRSNVMTSSECVFFKLENWKEGFYFLVFGNPTPHVTRVSWKKKFPAFQKKKDLLGEIMPNFSVDWSLAIPWGKMVIFKIQIMYLHSRHTPIFLGVPNLYLHSVELSRKSDCK